MFLGGTDTKNRAIYCPDSEDGKWIQITSSSFSEVFYFQCEKENFASLYTLLAIIENEESSAVFQRCLSEQQGVFSEDRFGFVCK